MGGIVLGAANAAREEGAAAELGQGVLEAEAGFDFKKEWGQLTSVGL
jgi:hypothetical protein